jgi:hypothetical protein
MTAPAEPAFTAGQFLSAGLFARARHQLGLPPDAPIVPLDQLVFWNECMEKLCTVMAHTSVVGSAEASHPARYDLKALQELAQRTAHGPRPAKPKLTREALGRQRHEEDQWTTSTLVARPTSTFLG